VTDEDRKDEEQPQAEQPSAEQAPPETEQPAENPDAPGREAEEASGGDSEQPAPEEASPETQEPAAEEAPAEAEQPAAEEASAEAEEPAAEEAPPAAKPADEPKDSAKAKDVPPGAELEPITIEPQRELSAEERARLEAEEEERAQREAELVGEGAEEEPQPASRAPAKLESGSRFQATGKRKRSIARVILVPGSGKFEVNSRSLEEFFPRPLHQTMARQPLTTTGYEGSVDVRVRVHGGGIGGQAGAVRHGISRALTEIDPELRGELKRRGFLTRDARVKERRKAGLKKARKRPQFSKR
jgi:small subunit ribosomal protein S9